MFLNKKVILISFILFIFLSISAINAENITDTTNSTPSFVDLDTQISEVEDGGTLDITENHKFNNGTDSNFTNGLIIKKNITINGSNASIDASNEARILFIDSNCSVTIRDLIFLNGYTNSSGGAIFLNDNSNLTLINCIFKNNLAYNSDGGAINTRTGVNLEIHNCEFENNTALRESSIEWAQFKAGMGSAICLRINSNLGVYDSKFRKNYAYMSTILVISYNDVEFKQSTFRLKGCLFEDNTIYNCGQIYVDEFGISEILDSTFTRNINQHSGGVLELDTCNSCTVQNCIFDQNQGTSGGAIKIKVFKDIYLSNVDIIACTFTKNTAVNYGGAIFAQHGVTSIMDCIFNENHAGKYGAAIYTTNSSIEISNSDFNKNTAGDHGGAIFFKSDANTVLNCAFKQNSVSKSGGAIYVSDGIVTIVESSFFKNSAKNGGALFLKGSINSVSDTSFTQNSATSKGGAIYSTVGKIKISSLTYSKNTASAASNVYGIFNAKLYHYTYKSNTFKLKIKITSPWKMSVAQQVKITVKGAKKSYTTKWLKTSSKGILIIVVPLNLNFGKYTVSVSMKEGVCNVNSFTKVKDKAKLSYQKRVKKHSKIKITVKNKASNKLIKKTKFKVKIYTGKKYKVYNIKTNSKGILNIKTTKLKKSWHKIIITLSNKNYNINNKIWIKVR